MNISGFVDYKKNYFICGITPYQYNFIKNKYNTFEVCSMFKQVNRCYNASHDVHKTNIAMRSSANSNKNVKFFAKFNAYLQKLTKTLILEMLHVSKLLNNRISNLHHKNIFKPLSYTRISYKKLRTVKKNNFIKKYYKFVKYINKCRRVGGGKKI